jgi:hypothetical protein
MPTSAWLNQMFGRLGLNAGPSRQSEGPSMYEMEGPSPALAR